MPLGRPREFDTEKALDRAMEVFWGKGYEGASLSDLTKAMGITRPSLYAAFGNKESLFLAALDRYAEGPAHYYGEALAAPTARAVVERLLSGNVELNAGPHNPGGCLIVHGALACSDASAPIRKALSARRARGEAAIRERFERAKAEGDLPADCDPAALARFVTTVIYGIAVQAAGGATRAQLRKVAETALRVWPT